MKLISGIGLVLLLTAPLHAETYSWVDDSGTYNFTEEYTNVPKKYRKNVIRRQDPVQGEQPQAAPLPEKSPLPPEKAEPKKAAAAGSAQELYGGKSHAAWRKELDVLEAELVVLEQRTELLRKQIYDPKGVTRDQLEKLKKDYNENRAAYDRKYKNYSALVEEIRKAGIVVEFK